MLREARIFAFFNPVIEHQSHEAVNYLIMHVSRTCAVYAFMYTCDSNTHTKNDLCAVSVNYFMRTSHSNTHIMYWISLRIPSGRFRGYAALVSIYMDRVSCEHKVYAPDANISVRHKSVHMHIRAPAKCSHKSTHRIVNTKYCVRVCVSRAHAGIKRKKYIRARARLLF